MSVRFKFKNDLDYQPIPCDGFHISVRDLKKTIIRNKKFGKVTDFDLLVTNSQTNKVYLDDNELISKNTTLTVQRAPLGEGKKKVWEEESSVSASIALASHTTTFSGIPGLNLSHNSADTEDDKISKMMNNSSEMYSEKHWTKFKGQRALPDGAKPPPHWKCSKCLANHWVSDCPFANNDMKRTTGIPRSFLKPAESNVPGAKINPQGLVVINEMEKLAYSEKKVEKNPWLQDEDDHKPAVPKANLPSELLCPICKDLLKDAVMMPCCAGSACDECARNGIIESEGSRCPVCADVANPEELIPYRLFRDKVDKFRNQTGYTKAAPTPPSQLYQSAKPTLPDIVLPDPADANFKFDTLAGHRAAPGVKVEPPNLHFNNAYGSPGLTGSPITDSPRGTSPPRQHLPPHTPTSTPPRSPGTPISSPQRSRSPSKRSRSPGTPYSNHNGSGGRGTPTPTTSPEHLKAPVYHPSVDTSVPPPMMYVAAPGPTLLPPGHVLAPSSHWPPPPPQLAPAPAQYQPAPLINASEDPLAAFEAAMRKLDSKKASRGRSSPPRAYRVDRPRSRSRERYRDYREREYSPRRRSPGGFRGYSPRRGDRGFSRGSGPRTPSPNSAGDSRNTMTSEGRNISPGRDYRGDSLGSTGSKQRKERYVTDIPPETEEERKERERFERELAERERYQKDRERDDQYSNYKRAEKSKGRVAPTPPREFLEREKETENKENEGDNRTPSLSPEPGTDQHDEYVRRKEEKQRGESDRDVRSNRDIDVRYKDERESHVKESERENNKSNEERNKENSRSKDEKEEDYGRSRETDNRPEGKERERSQGLRNHDRSRDRDVRDHDRSRDRDVRDHDRSRDRDVRDHDRSRDRDVRDHDRSRDRDVRDNDKSRDRDVRDHNRSRDKDIRDHDRPRDRDVRDRDRDARDRDRSRNRDVRDRERSKDRDVRDRDRSRDRDVRDQDRSRDRVQNDRSTHHERSEWDGGRERGRESNIRETSSRRHDGSNGRDGYRSDHAVDIKQERNGHKEVSEEREPDQDGGKESKKEKKSKKSKKKNKKKDKDSDSDEEGKENRKKKKKSKKKKDREESNDEQKPEEDIKPLVPYGEAEDTKTEESSENQDVKPPVDPTKFISSFSETKIEDTKPKLNLPLLVFNEKTVELAPKEVNSSEHSNNSQLNIETKTEFSTPSRSKDSAAVERHEKVSEIKREKKSSDLQIDRSHKKVPAVEAVPSVSSKWDSEDILTAEYPELDHPLVNNPLDPEYARELDVVKAAINGTQELSKSVKQDASAGPQNVLRKALANMEKDNLVRDKKRKSLEGEGSEPDNKDDSQAKKKKKKKKKKVETEDESSEEETKEKTKKKTKKKKKGGLDIPEKTLKKLLKKNLLKKKALEKLISSEGKKKKRKKRNSGETSDIENQEDKAKESSSEERIIKKVEKVGKRSRSKERKSRVSVEERIVRRKESHSEERRDRRREVSEERESKLVRKGSKRETSEEGREVKSSREGNIQVRLDNSTSRLSSSLAPSKSSLASTVQANLLKLAGQGDNGREERIRRNSPPRKSVKDRLGPLSRGGSSPVRRSSIRDKVDRNISRLGEDRLAIDRKGVKDRLGRNKETGGKDKDEREEGGGRGSKDRGEARGKTESSKERGGLGSVPADLQAWALKATVATNSPTKHVDSRERKKSKSLSLSSDEDRRKNKRRKSISIEKNANSSEIKGNNLRERKRSISREKRRKTPSEEKKSKKERKREKKRRSQDTLTENLPVKKRKNQRLTKDGERSFNTDSESD